MRYIKKILKNEPQSLIDYRRAPKAAYDDFRGKAKLRQVLLEEQGFLCAYCMKRIKDHPLETKIEHYNPQSNEDDDSLDYSNLFVCCLGNEGREPSLQHCDTKKGNIKIDINPSDKNCEKHLKYSTNGRILSKDDLYKKDLDETLNLNLEVIVKNRKKALDQALLTCKKKKPLNTWSRKFLENEINNYNTLREGRYPEYCQIIIFYLTKKINRLQG